MYPILSKSGLDYIQHDRLPNGPYVNATQYMKTAPGKDDEVLGVLLAYLHWTEAGTVKMSNLPASEINEAMNEMVRSFTALNRIQ